MTAKKWFLVVAAASLLFINATPAPAYASSTPYESYNYNYWEEAVPAPAAYVPDRVISGKELGVGDFVEPADMVVDDNGLIHVVDSGNNRIVRIDEKWQVQDIIDGFSNDGKRDGFKNPTGMYVDGDGMMYIADTDNGRVVVLDKDGSLVRFIEKPNSDILASDFKFAPLKVTVDKAKRVFVIAQGMFEGIMQFDPDGEFIGFVGTNKVQRDYTEFFWRLFSTKAQKAQMILFIPTEFSNIDIDAKGFVYATNIDPGSQEPVKRLNPSGEDVLKRYGYFHVKGDILYRLSVGPSKLIDVKVQNDGMYSVLDSNQGKIFTYNDEGDLLYVYGGKSNQAGTFKTPVAIESVGGNHLVLDRGKSNIVAFKPTKFGSKVNEAVMLHHNGEDKQAVPVWEEVLRLNANYDIAYIGIGKSLLMEKRNKEALQYFKLGMDRDGYSVAYKRYRREFMKEHFGNFLSVLVALAASWFAFKLYRAVSRKRKHKLNRPSGSGAQNIGEGKAL
ncbi:NHL repeat-containing protein [Paenibacillus harenae]|uniref:NHL repeat-containing protein n=1 Tax=Paenibacillus harenae TaxID=306543 RepID=UPI00040B6DB9|nr:NHL repeat-containing protein [Paenibacillus harenae]